MTLQIADTTTVNTYAQLVALYAGLADVHHEVRAWYPVYTIKQSSSKYEACIKHSLHEVNIKQTSSKHRAIRAHVVHVYFECICWMFAR